MAFTTKSDLPVIGSGTKFRVPPASIGDESDYTTGITNAGSSAWVLGSELKGRKALVTIATGALGAGATGLKCVLLKGTTSSGGSITVVTGTDFTSEPSTAADLANTVYQYELDLSKVDSTTAYYSLGLSVKGSGAGTLIAGASATFLDPKHV